MMTTRVLGLAGLGFALALGCRDDPPVPYRGTTENAGEPAGAQPNASAGEGGIPATSGASDGGTAGRGHGGGRGGKESGAGGTSAGRGAGGNPSRAGTGSGA